MFESQEQENHPVLIYTTFPDSEEAERVTGALVEERLAACANILSGMTAVFRWEGKINTEREVVAIVKTRLGVSRAAMARLEALHSYETPAILQLSVTDGANEFCQWIAAETGGRVEAEQAAGSDGQ